MGLVILQALATLALALFGARAASVAYLALTLRRQLLFVAACVACALAWGVAAHILVTPL